jgi:hypothetical protein
MYALVAGIALNTSLVGSLAKISGQASNPAAVITLPAIFLNRQGALTPLYAIAVVNQLLLLGLCFVYFGLLKGVGAYLIGLAIGVVSDLLIGRLKWFGVYLYPIPIVVLTVLAFTQRP